MTLLEIILNPLTGPPLLFGLMVINDRIIRLGNQLRLQGYSKIQIQDFYVANPRIRDIIEKNTRIPSDVWFRRFLNILIVLLCTVAILVNFLELLAEFIIGYFICRAIDNTHQILHTVVEFRSYQKNPGYITGQVQVSSAFMYNSLRGVVMTSALIWTIIFLLVGRTFFLGGCVASIVLILQVLQWEKQDLKKNRNLGKV